MKLQLDDLELEGIAGRDSIGVVDVGAYRWRLKHRPSGLMLEDTHPEEEMDRGPWAIVQLVHQMAEIVEEWTPGGSITHVASFPCDIGGRFIRQLCAWCGAELIEYDLDRVAVPIDDPRPPATWPTGHYVRLEGGVSVDVGTEKDHAPDDVCWLQNPAIAAQRAANREREAAEQAERARLHAMDNFLDECDVQTNNVGAEPYTMVITHERTGLSVSDLTFGGELETRNQLLQRLHANVRNHDEWYARQEARATLLKDCQVDVFTGTGHGIRVVHKPSGLLVEGPVIGTELETRGRLLDELRAQLEAKATADRRAALLADCDVRVESFGNALAHEPDRGLIIDHRPTGLRVGDVVAPGDPSNDVTRDRLLDELQARLDERDAAERMRAAVSDATKDRGVLVPEEEEPGYRPAPDAEELQEPERPEDVVQEWSTADPPEMTAAEAAVEGYTPSTRSPDTQDPPEASQP